MQLKKKKKKSIPQLPGTLLCDHERSFERTTLPLLVSHYYQINDR
jgi:hypothetical protein